MKGKSLMLAVAMLLLPAALRAQERHVATFQVFFENDRTDWTAGCFAWPFCGTDNAVSIDSLRIVGFASPAGPRAHNLELSEQRADTVALFMAKSHPSVPTAVAFEGEDWDTLAGLLEKENTGEALQALEIIRNTPIYVHDARGRIIDGRKHRLMRLNGGRTYRRLSEDYFWALRRTDVTAWYTVSCPCKDAELDTLITEHVQVDTIVGPKVDSSNVKPTAVPADTMAWAPELRRIIFAPRTNLLVPLANIGLEVPIGNHITVAADWYTPWIWPASNNRNCFEFQAASAELRWWFNPRPMNGYVGHTLTGHTVGVSAFAGHYDFEHNYEGFQGEVWGASIDYTYSFFLKEHFRLEVGLGFGYARFPWRDYKVWEDGGKLIRTSFTDSVRDWFGPTRATVTLSVPISIPVKAKEGLKYD